MPTGLYTHAGKGVRLNCSITIRQALFRSESILSAWHDWAHTGEIKGKHYLDSTVGGALTGQHIMFAPGWGPFLPIVCCHVFGYRVT